MTCPKCLGLMEGPDWERTDQGYVYTVRCFNCGFRVNDCFVRQLDSGFKKREHKNREFAKNYSSDKKSIDLTKYDFGGECFIHLSSPPATT